MARITLYNSNAAVLTDGTPVTDVDRWPANLQAADSLANSGRSVALRLIGVADIHYVSYELFFELTDPQDVLNFRWFQEFYSDFIENAASTVLPPTSVYPLVYRPNAYTGYEASLAAWSRELDVENAGSGNINHFPVTRRISVVPDVSAPNLLPPPLGPAANNRPHQASLHAVLAVQAHWARLGFWIDWESSIINGDPADVNLYIAATVAGHQEFEYLGQNPGIPYAYDAFVGQPLPRGVKVIKKGDRGL
jgi:hypothetical protein